MSLILLLFTAVLSAQTPNPQQIGPQIGERVPDFSANDQTGQTRTLRSLIGPKGALLVFFRSADW